MKKLLLVLTVFLGVNMSALACTNETIDSMISPINPYEEQIVGQQVEAALDAIGLCDENLLYAGYKLGNEFNPYEQRSTQIMASVVRHQSSLLPQELVNGLGLGLISRLNLYELNSTYYMLQAILRMGEVAPEHAKQLAIELLKKQNAYEKEANNLLLQTVRSLRNLAPKPPPEPAPVLPPPVISPIWAFRSNSEPCSGLQGPWGYYDLCPRYYASVSDQFGNRIVLACNAQNYGVEFRVTLSPNNWSKISGTYVQSLAFGTSSALQSLGVPYMVNQDYTLMTQETVAAEILNQLRSANTLYINIRANSGELNTKLTFSLKGSNAAIGQLLQHCR